MILTNTFLLDSMLHRLKIIKMYISCSFHVVLLKNMVFILVHFVAILLGALGTVKECVLDMSVQNTDSDPTVML